jgi:Ca2+ transporting ATPase
MIHSEPQGGPFKLLASDLIRLVETPHEHQSEQLSKLGGITGVATALGVDIHQGLDSGNVTDLKRREEAFGSNFIAPPRAKGLLELMWDAFQDVTIVVLTMSGIVSVILSVTVGDHPDTGWIEGACIIFAVFVVTFVTAINDYQKEAQFRSLNAVKEDEKIKVIRNGQPAEVSKFGLMVGDIVRVDLGDIMPADGIVFDEKELKLDESAMTGESDLLTKNADSPFLLSGTKVMEGLGRMLVICVGENSQAGIIKKLIQGKDKKKEKGEKGKPAPVTPAQNIPATQQAPLDPNANGTVEQRRSTKSTGRHLSS